MSLLLTDTVTLATEVCCVCGVVFAMPKELQDKRKRDGSGFYCPNGHSQIYTESTEEKLRKAQKQLSQKEFELMTERNLHLATQKKMKRLEKRVSNGICPCCHRQFVNMTRHMKNQHPEFAKDGK